ncbi:MAG: serine/threonine-protein phosphatase [Bacteroidales bacterium]|nr:serine/threonine-protein phosphatase [Bacteroidales bacterium]
MSKIKLSLTALTNVGLIRTNNEDNFIVCQDLTTDNWFVPQEGSEPFELGEKGSMMVVADGMGGMNAGEVASDIAVKTVKEFFAPDKLTQEITANTTAIHTYMKQVVIEADNRIKRRSASDTATEGMGTTIVMAWAIGEDVHIAWCGDSRAYSYHPNSGLRQLSKDHSYVQELVDAGKLLPELAFDHPDSNIITSSLGDLSKPAAPDVITCHLHEGEVILLCSDGLCGMLRDSEMQQVLDAYYPDLGQCKKNLIEGALTAGGHDNVTLTMLKVVKAGAKMPLQKEDQPVTSSGEKKTLEGVKNPNKKKNIVIGGFIVLLLVIIGILSVKLFLSKPLEDGEQTDLAVTDTLTHNDTAAQELSETPMDKKESAPKEDTEVKKKLKEIVASQKKTEEGEINKKPNENLTPVPKPVEDAIEKTEKGNDTTSKK